MVSLDATKECLGDRLKAYREFKGMTTAEFAASIEIGVPTLLAWESGMRTPTIGVSLAIKDAHGLSLDWLFDGDTRLLPREFLAYIRKRNA